MNQWNNLDTLKAYRAIRDGGKKVDLTKELAGDKGAERVARYQVPMGAGLAFSYAAKQVDDDLLAKLSALANECGLAEKFEELYNGAVINTGEMRLVLHHLTRGQLGKAVIADGKDKREFYTAQQEKIAEFAGKVHRGEILNEKGEKFTTAVHIGIGGSDLGPRAMYLALENWARKNGTLLNAKNRRIHCTH